MKNLFSAIRHNYKSTLSGVVVLSALALHVSVNPAALLDSSTLAGFATGIGLLVAKDADKSNLPQVTVNLPKSEE